MRQEKYSNIIEEQIFPGTHPGIISKLEDFELLELQKIVETTITNFNNYPTRYTVRLMLVVPGKFRRQGVNIPADIYRKLSVKIIDQLDKNCWV